ncbi:DUF4142 domain-containing protein [Halomonas sp. Bachu 37]|uniref:DUF4142 domain-containing protein n=1 Tax=Halomonas kashgarensis TaxID=3084920 RepID=UPI003217AC19
MRMVYQPVGILLGTLTFAAATFATADESASSDPMSRLSQFHQHQQTLGLLAQERADADEISELAEEFAVDHGILEEWLNEAGHSSPPSDESSTGYSAGENEAYTTLQRQQGAEFDSQFLAYQEDIHRQALEYLEKNRPESIEQSEQANHLKVTHETLRRHLGMLQNQRQEGDNPSSDE